jgi:dihydrofolate synthase/folylpolyglutamate synthase
VAVLRDHTKLIRTPMPAEVEEVVDRAAEERHAEDLEVEIESTSGHVPFDQRNFSLALTAVHLLLGELEADATNRVQETIRIPGRAEVEPGDPPVIYDAAHNPDGARAIAEEIPRLAGDREVVCCLAILEGKDATGIVSALAPAVSRFVCTEIPPERIEGSGRPGGRSRPALEVAALCQKAGVEAEAITDPLAAWERARELAKERNGVALAAGSHYLLSSIWTERPAQSS